MAYRPRTYPEPTRTERFVARLVLLLAAGAILGALSESLVYPAGQSSASGLPLMAFSPLTIGSSSSAGSIYGSLFVGYVVIGVLSLVGACGYLRPGGVGALIPVMALTALVTAFFWLVFAVARDLNAGPAFPLMLIALLLDTVALSVGRLRRAWVRPSKRRQPSALGWG